MYSCSACQEEEDIRSVPETRSPGKESSCKKARNEAMEPIKFSNAPPPFLPIRAALGEGRVRKMAEELKVDFTFLDRSGLDKLCGDRPHQVIG